MRYVLLAVLATGCQYLIGLDDTKLQPDAPTPDAMEGPPISVGDGADGPLVVSGVSYTDEARVSLTAQVGAGSTLLNVTDVTGFAADDEVMIMQMAGDAAGQYEMHDIATIMPGQLLLATPLEAGYQIGATGATQVIRVPNYTTVTILNGGRLTAHAWDGVTGGVVAFRASGKLQIDEGGRLDADALGFAGGTPGTGGTGGTGGMGGALGVKAMCFGLCATSVATAGGGGPGQIDVGANGGPGLVAGKCTGGAGGRGGAHGMTGQPAEPGSPSTGFGAGATSDVASTNVTANIAHPLLGGGGAGAAGGNGGTGAGGGGGGGGSVGSADGQPGGAGQPGGTGGAGGAGGRGGGIVIVQAMEVDLAGMVSVTGEPGAPGAVGDVGGTGGNGGGGGQSACGGVLAYGGRGGGGTGANGGDGGNGGGGGAGGVVVLDAFTITASPGTGAARATGGDGGIAGPGGGAGSAGAGYDDAMDPNDGALPGTEGASGTAGATGGAGFFYLRYVNTCAGCSLGDPPVIVMQL